MYAEKDLYYPLARQEALDQTYALAAEKFVADLAHDTKKQDAILDCFAGVGDPEPLREALVLWSKLSQDKAEAAIGKMIWRHLTDAFERVEVA